MVSTATVFFFFSSRRRHTRCSRDWSSDVCSSDLLGRRRGRLEVAPWRRGGGGRRNRSEERRVGKECRSRRAPHHQKKKNHINGQPHHAHKKCMPNSVHPRPQQQYLLLPHPQRLIT